MEVSNPGGASNGKEKDIRWFVLASVYLHDF